MCKRKWHTTNKILNFIKSSVVMDFVLVSAIFHLLWMILCVIIIFVYWKILKIVSRNIFFEHIVYIIPFSIINLLIIIIKNNQFLLNKSISFYISICDFIHAPILMLFIVIFFTYSFLRAGKTLIYAGQIFWESIMSIPKK
jgi:hypothetical protein